MPLRWRFLLCCSLQFFSKGLPGFFQYYVEIEVDIDREKLDPTGIFSQQSLYDGDARGVIRSALYAAVGAEGRSNKRAAGKLISPGAEQRLRKMVYNDPSLMDTTQTLRFAMDDDVDSFLRGFINRETPEKDRRINDRMVEYIDRLQADGKIVICILRLSYFRQRVAQPRNGRHLWCVYRINPHALGLPCARVSHWRCHRDLLGGNSPEEPHYRNYRDQYQQSCGGPLCRVWYSGFGGFYWYFWYATVDPADWGGGARPYDAADNHHFVAAPQSAPCHPAYAKPLWGLARHRYKRYFTT